MKKNLVLGLCISQAVMANGGIEIATANTTTAIANPAQYANISAESPYYNPAGTAFLEDGQHLHTSFYRSDIDYSTDINGSSIDTREPQYSGALAYTYVENGRAYYLAFGPMGQGGFLKHDETDIFKTLDIGATHLGLIFGSSKKISEDLSLSVGGRAVHSRYDLKAKTNNLAFRGHSDALGISPEIGIHYKLDENIDLGVKYLFRMKLDYEGESNNSKYTADGRKDFPSMLSLGGSYKLNDNQKIMIGYNWIMESNKKSSDLWEEYQDTYEYSLGYEQKLNEKLDLILGYRYIDKGIGDDELVDFTELSGHHIGVGLRQKIAENSEIIYVVGGIKYKDEVSKISVLEVESKRFEPCVGITYNTKL